MHALCVFSVLFSVFFIVFFTKNALLHQGPSTLSSPLLVSEEHKLINYKDSKT
jgi:hypothetical protein